MHVIHTQYTCMLIFSYAVPESPVSSIPVSAAPETGVERSFKMCDAAAVEVSEVADLQLYRVNDSWCNELQHILEELKALPDHARQTYVLISFLHCSGVITFYRFHVVLVPQVLSCEPEIHPIELEGAAKSKALLVYAHAQLNIKNLKKELGITAHTEGVLLAPEFEGDIPKLKVEMEQLDDTPHGLKDTERYLDTVILRELQSRYEKFATPRILHTVPSVGVAMAVN